MVLTTTAKAGFWAGFMALFIGFIWIFNSILTPFILGITIAYLLDPVMRTMSVKHVPRWASSVTILLLFFGTLSLLFVLLAPLAFRQAQELIQQVPNYLQNTLEYLDPYLSWIQTRVGPDYIEQVNTYVKENADKLLNVTGGIVGGVAAGGKFVVGAATTIALTPLVAFFMMVEWPRIVAWVEGLYPRQHVALIRGLLTKIDGKVAGFIRGQIIVAFILGLIYALALAIAGLNYGFLIGIGAGILSIIPLVGSTLGLVVSVVVAWFQTGDLVYTGIIAAIFLTGQFIEGNFLSPKIVGDSVGLHPLWVIFALLAGGSLFGIVGMLIAVPVAAVIGVLSGFAIDRYKASPLYQRDMDENSAIIITEAKDA